MMENRKKKLAVLFPGVGYTCGRPLLHYTGSLAQDRGYELVRLDYGPDIHSFRGRDRKELERLVCLAVERTLPVLQEIPRQEYEEILMISKSIGTAVACETAQLLGWKVRHFLMTPIEATLPYLEQAEGVFVAGTGDDYMEPSLVRKIAEDYPEKAAAIFEGCNHSLERRGDTFGNLERLRKVLESLEKLL